MLVTFENDGTTKQYQSKIKEKKSKKNLIYLFYISLFIILLIYFLSFIKKFEKKYDIIINLHGQIIKKLKYIDKFINNKYFEISSFNNSYNFEQTEEFDFNQEKKYIENQHHFCKNNDLFFDREIESKIKKTRAHLNNVSFEMFIYNSTDYASNSISMYGSYENYSTYKILDSLNYYSKIKNLTKNNITILDIGAHVGWYSFYLSNSGYELYSFEISKINSYILKKNFCLNEDIKITIINKGISLEREKCLLHHPSHNIGNGVILCGENKNIARNTEKLSEEVEFTKLRNFYNYLSKKNIALIKLDVEGTEGKVISSGFEFISEYHVPFLFIEFKNDYLKMQGTDPKEFLKIFEKNGYLFSNRDFLSKSYLTIEQILKLKSTNLYIIYSKFLH